MITKPVIDRRDARILIEAALSKAEAMGRPVSVAICDWGGHPVALERMDGAGLMTAKVAADKARTAALLRAPSSVLAERVPTNPALLRLEEYLPMPGGIPVKSGDHCIGGIGISGGSDEEDVAIAQHALEALGSPAG
ncbi:GlcG/HbpS family heme-binding protein [Pacificimonas sp. ICDLI1SI03]